jgi:hypothetical protein
MLELRRIERDILAKGRVDSHDLEALHRQLYAGETVDRAGADFIVELHKRVQHRTPAFDHFFYRAIKAHILGAGRIDAAASAWLRRVLVDGGAISDEGRKFLHELKGEAEDAGPEFGVLFAEGMKLPQEQHTCG